MQSETNTLYGLPEFLTLTRKVVILKSLRYGYLVRIPVPGTLGAIGFPQETYPVPGTRMNINKDSKCKVLPVCGA